jgi:hypothetical protein
VGVIVAIQGRLARSGRPLPTSSRRSSRCRATRRSASVTWCSAFARSCSTERAEKDRPSYQTRRLSCARRASRRVKALKPDPTLRPGEGRPWLLAMSWTPREPSSAPGVRPWCARFLDGIGLQLRGVWNAAQSTPTSIYDSAASRRPSARSRSGRTNVAEATRRSVVTRHCLSKNNLDSETGRVPRGGCPGRAIAGRAGLSASYRKSSKPSLTR